MKEEHVKNAFSGEGAQKYGGRWNHRGTKVVYLSDSLSLSVLEQFVHLNISHVKLIFVYFLVKILKNVSIDILKVEELPNNWREEPPSDECKSIGTNWVKESNSAVLEIPSVIIPIQKNYVLNIEHEDFKKIKIIQKDKFSFDPRMWK